MDINHNHTTPTNPHLHSEVGDIAVNNYLSNGTIHKQETPPKESPTILSKLQKFLSPSKQNHVSPEDNNTTSSPVHVLKHSNGGSRIPNGHAGNNHSHVDNHHRLSSSSSDHQENVNHHNHNHVRTSTSGFSISSSEAERALLEKQSSAMSIELKDIEGYGGNRNRSSSSKNVGSEDMGSIATPSSVNITGSGTDGAVGGEEDDGGGGWVKAFVQTHKNRDKTDTMHFINEVTNRPTGAEPGPPAEDFQMQLSTLVEEITTKVLIAQPADINAYIADYLEDKIKRERKTVPKPRGAMFKRRDSKVGKMLFRHASLLAKTGALAGNKKGPMSFTELVARSQISAARTWYYEMPEDPNIVTLKGHKDVVTQCSFHNDYVITSSLDTNICVFDIKTTRKVISIPNHKPVHCFVLIPSTDTKILILAGTDDGQVPGWRIKFGNKVSAKLKVMIPMHQPNPIRAMEMSPNLKYLATGCCFVMTQISLWGFIEPSVRGTLKTWDLTSVINYALDPKNYYDDIEHLGLKTYKQIIARTEKLTKRMSSYSKLTEGDMAEEKYHGIRALAFTPDESKIIVGFGHPEAEDVQDMKMMAVVEVSTLETVWIQYASFYQINGLQFDPTCEQPGGTWPWRFCVATERHLYCAELEQKDETNEKSKIKIKFPWRLDFPTGHQGGSFSPEGHVIASSSGKQVLLFEAANGKQIGSYSGHTGEIVNIAYAKSGKYIGSTSRDKTVRVWKVPLRTHQQPKDKVGPTISKMKLPTIVDHPNDATDSEKRARNSLSDKKRSMLMSLGGRTGMMKEKMPSLDTSGARCNNGDKGSRSRSPSPNRSQLSPTPHNGSGNNKTMRSSSRSPSPTLSPVSQRRQKQHKMKRRTDDVILKKKLTKNEHDGTKSKFLSEMEIRKLSNKSRSRSRSPNPRDDGVTPKLAYSGCAGAGGESEGEHERVEIDKNSKKVNFVVQARPKVLPNGKTSSVQIYNMG